MSRLGFGRSWIGHITSDSTGRTGRASDVGGRLWRRLEQEGRRVRCLGRRQAGVQRIIYYLGDLWYGEVLSPHLRSRHEVGEALRESGVPVLEMHQQSRGQS